MELGSMQHFLIMGNADDVPPSQANSIVSHPTMPLLITAHEDKHIRIFDIVTGEYTENQRRQCMY